MVWFILSLIGAFLDATYYMFLKKYLKNIDQYVLASGVYLFTFVILITISLIKGLPAIQEGFFLALSITVGINLIAVTLLLKALKTTDLSLTVPMMSFTPAFLILTSFLILGEFPSLIGIAGIVLIVIGSYVLNLNAKKKGLFYPLKELFRNKGMLFMLIVAFLFSISSNYDKLTVLKSDTVFSSSMFCLFLGLLFLFISMGKKKPVLNVYQDKFYKFLLIAIILSAGAIAINSALTMQIVPYVLSIKRISIIFSVLYGFWIFKEKHLLNRAVGAVIMLLGAITIIAF